MLNEYLRNRNRYIGWRLLKIYMPVKKYRCHFTIHWGDVQQSCLTISKVTGNCDYEQWLIMLIENHLHVYLNYYLYPAENKQLAEMCGEGFLTNIYGIKNLSKFNIDEVIKPAVFGDFEVGRKQVEVDFWSFKKAIKDFEKAELGDNCDLIDYIILKTVVDD